MNPPITPRAEQMIQSIYPGLHEPARGLIDLVFKRTGKRIQYIQGLRTMEYQLEIYRQGRKRLPDGSWVIIDPHKIVTNAPPGKSWHNFGLALDAAQVGLDPFFEKLKQSERDQFWEKYGFFAKSIGFEWGIKLQNGSTDFGHIEMTFGMTLVEAMQAFQVAGVSSVWQRLDKIRGATKK